MCMCQQGGEVFGREVIEQGGDLFDFFEKLVVHRALRVHHFVRVARVRGKCISGGVSALFGSWFPRHFCMTLSSPASFFEESCFCLIDCVEPLPLS